MKLTPMLNTSVLCWFSGCAPLSANTFSSSGATLALNSTHIAFIASAIQQLLQPTTLARPTPLVDQLDLAHIVKQDILWPDVTDLLFITLSKLEVLAAFQHIVQQIP